MLEVQPQLSKIIILAAGRGNRMRPLTDSLPKPLLKVRGVPLLTHHLLAFERAGYERAHINTCWLEEKIVSFYSQSANYREHLLSTQMSLSFSTEGADFGFALETAGGIIRALPKLENIFWAVAGDIYIPGFDFKTEYATKLSNSPFLAHLFLVPNPPHNPNCDFALGSNGIALNLTGGGEQLEKFTYSSIGLFKKSFFQHPINSIEPGNPSGIKAPLAPLLRQAMSLGLVSAELMTSEWTDVGTPERLAQLNIS